VDFKLVHAAFAPDVGTVVLVGGTPSAVNPALEASGALGPTIILNNCQVTTHDILNLRDAPSPSGQVIRLIPYDVTLTAFERTSAWFYVDFLGERGWISAG
jgi:hypothetical protein